MTTPPSSLLRLDSPLGRLELSGNGEAVTALAIERGSRLPRDGEAEASDAVLEAAAAQLREYFAGQRGSFEVPVELPGTPFQLAIWEQLVRLDFGEVVSYGDLGRGTGRATAGRAVGGAVGANPVPLLVPCHRVLGQNGTITGYSAGEGIPTKAWLLAHEGIPFRLPSAERSSAPTLADDATWGAGAA